MLNKTMLIGRVGAEPEMRYSAHGTAITPFRVAINRRHTEHETGERTEETTWFSCVAFQRLAETAATLLHTGSLVFVEGRMQSHRYTNRQHIELTAWDLIVERLDVLDRRGEVTILAEEAPPPESDVRR